MSLVSSFERGLLGRLSPAGHRARLLILTYHRVPDSRDPILPDEPDAAEFAAHMDILRYFCHVLPLPEAVRRLREGSLPARAAAITFDDGYENNLTVALPILERHGMAATIFIAADAVERGIMWNDLLIEALRKAGSAVGYSEFGLGELPGADVPEPERVMRVVRHIRYEQADRRWEQAFAFHQKVIGPSIRRLMLTEAQVRDVARRGHDVGAHTIHHPILKGLTVADATKEIAGSYAWVADVTGLSPRSFAYPNGFPGRDYDESHATIARSAGFDLAVSMRRGCATMRSDPFHLPRCLPWDIRSRSYPLRLAQTYIREAD
jgi:peptidoglycan/xylan/chitin deacetylase (PgdA/CDA1 family)